jgi:hypothetical protein
MQVCTQVVGVLYVSIRALAWGPIRYWKRSAVNKFDVIIIGSTVILPILVTLRFIPEIAGSTVLFIRFLRLARVCRFIRGFTPTVGAFWAILPLTGHYVLILMGCLYFFAIIGLHSWGGKLKPDNPEVAASSYGIYNYYAIINFDNLPNAMFAIFYLLSV